MAFNTLKPIVAVTFTLLCAVPVDADLANLAQITERTSHRSSSHDRTGGNTDSLVSFEPGATHVLLDTHGPGKITHIWFTVASFPNHPTFLRDLVIRMYWEGAEAPSVEVPLGDFFALGHGKTYTLRSQPVAVGINDRAMNCYWPMPFYKHARLELHNNGLRSLRRIYFNINYELGELPPDLGLFHAAFRRDRELRSQGHGGNTTGKDNYVILDTQGEGQYVGCALFVDSQPGGWWGEGDEMIFIDGSERPTIIGTGSEDYFCNAWGYSEAFSYPYYGAPLLETRDDGGKFTTVYRWHVPDPVRFQESIKVTIEHLFGENIVNDYSSVAYWYQRQPLARRDPLPAGTANHPKSYASPPAEVNFEIDATELEADLQTRGVAARSVTVNLHEGFKNGGWLRIDTGGKPVTLHIPVPQPGRYSVAMRSNNALITEPLKATLESADPVIIEEPTGRQHDAPHTDLGETTARNNKLTLALEGPKTIGLDHFIIRRVE